MKIAPSSIQTIKTPATDLGGVAQKPAVEAQQVQAPQAKPAPVAAEVSQQSRALGGAGADGSSSSAAFVAQQAGRAPSKTGAMFARMELLAGPKKFSLDDVKFDSAATVVPSQDRLKASRFSVPIPAFQGGALVHPDTYPADMRNKDGTPHPMAGKPLPDDIRGKPLQTWDGKPITRADGQPATGVVFFNYEDQKFQAMQDSGDKIFLFNRPSPEQGAKLQAYIEKQGGPSSLNTPAKVNDMLAFAKSIGLDDRYDSDTKYAKGKLTVTADQSTGVEAFGMHMRANEMVKAVFIEGPVQVADVRLGKEGGVFLLVGEKDGKRDLRHVTPGAFTDTYTASSGAPVFAEDLPKLKLG